MTNPEPDPDREVPAAGVVDAAGDELQVKSAGEIDDRVEHCRQPGIASLLDERGIELDDVDRAVAHLA